jgi:hypothetical protein
MNQDLKQELIDYIRSLYISNRISKSQRATYATYHDDKGKKHQGYNSISKLLVEMKIHNKYLWTQLKNINYPMLNGHDELVLKVSVWIIEKKTDIYLNKYIDKYLNE